VKVAKPLQWPSEVFNAKELRFEEALKRAENYKWYIA